MDGVTDAPARFVAKKYGQADIIYTEFVSAEGLWRIHKRGDAEEKIWKDLKYGEIERPVIAQIFGSDPEAFYESAKIIYQLGFDGIDINMGCPSPGLEKRGGGAGLIRDKCNAKEVIEATRKGSGGLPVSVKTRIGSAEPDESWWRFLAEQNLPVVAMHGRTFKQLYKGEADWDLLLKAGEIIREGGTKFLGNGDISQIYCQFGPVQFFGSAASTSQGSEGIPAPKLDSSSTDSLIFAVGLKSGKKIDLFGKMDGVLIGREALGNPWILRKDGYVPTLKEKLQVMVEHAYKYQELMGNDYGKEDYQFFPMRKHLVSYVKGFEGSAGLRKQLVTATSAEEVDDIVSAFIL